MYSIENYDNLEKGTINRSECAKRTILSNFKTNWANTKFLN